MIRFCRFRSARFAAFVLAAASLLIPVIVSAQTSATNAPIDSIVALVDDATMAELHQRFLGQSGPTDVLSFPHGEIVVSADTARREAIARGIPPLHELVLYVVHGALHLAGFDDKKPKQAARMRVTGLCHL